MAKRCTDEFGRDAVRIAISSGLTTARQSMRGPVANFHGWFQFRPDPGIAFAKSCRRETLHDH
jgi:hypothetical protein